MTKPDHDAAGSDWKRIAAMTDEDRVTGALSDPDAQPLSAEMLARATRANDVKAIRARLRMTQAEFAAAYRLPISTLRDWDQTRSQPDAPARALLKAIGNDPLAMRRLVRGGPPPFDEKAALEASRRLAGMGGSMPDAKAPPRRRPWGR